MFSAVDAIWTFLGAFLVFFMQAGFAMVETGFTRAKNAGNIIMKNFMDFSLGTIVFWCLGFGIMFGENTPFIGAFDFLIQGNYDSTIPTFAFVLFQTVFCATAATIVSGAVAERTKFSSYCVCSLVLSAVVYPISGHWIWGGGWLSEMGFLDFAGSTTVHMVGGVAAFIGAKIVGPRIGKYDKDGTPNAIPGHSLTLGALGVFILWFCWFGFNGGSTVSMTGDDVIENAASILMTTNIAASTSTAGAMVLTWVRYKKPDISMTLNGSLAGLVAITAGCDVVSNTGAFFIGLVAAFVVVYGIEFIEKVCKVDDPVGAVGVHGLCGAVGTILIGVFAVDGGLLYGGGAELLGIQALGVAAVALWVAVTMTITFVVVDRTMGLRVSEEEEISGLDMMEHGLASSYADFMPVSFSGEAMQTSSAGSVPVDVALPIVAQTNPDVAMKRIVVITKQSRFEKLKAALDEIGITGMTVTQVLGYGSKPTSDELYRGAKLAPVLHPKVEIEIIIAKVPLDLIIATIKKSLYTGKVGDGKIFISDVNSVIRVRTGEENYDALQDEM
ncbi:MAG: ammonium transporter [Bacillota bacterium]